MRDTKCAVVELNLSSVGAQGGFSQKQQFTRLGPESRSKLIAVKAGGGEKKGLGHWHAELYIKAFGYTARCWRVGVFPALSEVLGRDATLHHTRPSLKLAATRGTS